MMFIVMLALIFGANFYVFFRLWHMMPPVGPWRTLVVVFGILAVSSLFIALFARNLLPLWLLTFLYRLGTAWVIIMLYAMLIFLVADILRLTGVPLGKYMFDSWAGFAAVCGLLALILMPGYIKYDNKTRVDLPLTVAKYDPAAAPLKIVAVSDLHLGMDIGAGEFSRWVDMINAEKPDIVVMAGDIIDNELKSVNKMGMDAIFHRLDAPLGVYACPGNHEYISGAQGAFEFLERAGVTVLRDSAALIDGRLYVVGRDDRANPGRKPLAEIMRSLDENIPVLVLDHQPYELEEAENAGAAVQFSGHTHRGQVWPITWVTDKLFEVSHGYKQKGDTHYYVSSGLGIWGGKFRIGSQSEYIVITLKNK